MALPSRKIEGVLSALEEIYGRPRIIARFDPMEELVSCIMSQHTSDANSFPAFTRLRETYADWQDVVDGGPERLAEVIQKAGLAKQKSKNIVATLQALHARFGEYSLEGLRGMPMLEARSWLVTLPGVGPKTASIVLCFAFGEDAIPVDTHVFRVSWRLGAIPQSIGENKAHDALLKKVPRGLAFRYHSTLIQHGRITCRAPLPDCGACPVKEQCDWHKRGGPGKRAAELKLTRSKAKPRAS